MLSNMKLIVGCLCHVPQPQRFSAEQMDSINVTNWNWKIDPPNGEKIIKVPEVQGTEMKVCFSYIFHVAIMQT
jgi:hypothetical protein